MVTSLTQQIANIEQAVLNHFLPAGYSVLFVSMPLYGPNKDPRYPNPVSHDTFYAQTPNAIRYFLEPMVAFVNYLEPSYRRIVMVGLSGGGWTTVVYSALDTRIAQSYPVAGSYPGYITREVPMSRDAEQKDSARGTFRLEFNGIDKTGLFTVPNTGGWQTWQTLSKTGIFLNAGQHVMRLYETNAGASGSIANINWVRFTATPATGQTPYTGTPANIPGMVQAEDFDNGGEGVAYHDSDPENWRGNVYRTSAVEVGPTSDTGGGYTIGYTRTGEWLEYTVNVASAGYYRVEARVASQGSGGTFRLEFNGIDRLYRANSLTRSTSG